MVAPLLSENDSPDLGVGMSRFHFHSIGTVAANKKLTQNTIEVVLDEHFSYIDGEVTDHKKEQKEKGKDYSGGEWEVKIDSTPSVMAHWLPLGNTNRITSPDVRRGESVMIYRMADTDQYWWMDMMQYKHIRRLETIIYSISDNKEEDVEDTPDSTYWFEWSTHRQVVRLHTSKSNGEPFVYDIEINAKEGRIIIQDDDGNYIFLDSPERRIKLRNKDNSFIDIDKKKIWGNADDEIKWTTTHFIIEAKETIDTTTQTYTEKNTDYSNTSKATARHEAGETFDIKVGTDYTLDVKQDYRETIGRDFNGEIKQDYTYIIRRDFNESVRRDYVYEVRRDFMHTTRREHVWNISAQINGNLIVTGNIRGGSYSGGHHGA